MLTAIVNHLWQSTLAVGAITALAATLRNHGAHVRYWLWFSASVKFLVPFSLLTLLGSKLGVAHAPLLDVATWPATLGVLAEPMPRTTSWSALAVALVGIWALGALAVAGSWIGQTRHVRALLRAAVPCTTPLPSCGRALEARISPALVEPSLVGISRPVLLLPLGLAEVLTSTQLDAVLAHELAHWRRRDNLTAAVQMLVEALVWFHPLVWWIGARLIEERERACDEAVLRAGHDGRTYAEGILNVCEHYVASTLKCSAGVSGADLKRRVVEIGRNRPMSELSIAKKVLLASFALAAVIGPIFFGAFSGRAVAQDNSDLIPLVRIAPNYPPEALAAHRDGEVWLSFTISVQGTTKDIRVLSSPSPEFETPARDAVLRWRYRPQMLNGVPAERYDVRTIIRFQLTSDCTGAPGAQQAAVPPGCPDANVAFPKP
jgi:TonB family protein